MAAMIRSEVSVNESVLFVAFELGKKSWKLAMTTGLAVTPWLQTVAGGRSGGGGRGAAAGAGALWRGGGGAGDQLL